MMRLFHNGMSVMLSSFRYILEISIFNFIYIFIYFILLLRRSSILRKI